MRYKTSNLGNLAWFLTVLLFSHACSSVPLTKKQQAICPKCEDPHRYIRMIAWPGGQQSVSVKIAHPLRLSSQDWARVLKEIRVRNTSEGFLLFESKGAASQAFTPDEIIYLSATLSKSFADVQPDKLAVFGLSRVKSNDFIEVTTGGWYAEGTRIHLLLANYRQSVTMPNILERLWRNPLATGITPVFDIVPGEHQKLGTSSKTLRGMTKSDIPDLSIDYQALLAKSSNGDNHAPTAAPSANDATVEERMRKLKRLKENGLITEEEFLEKRKKLLENL